MSERVCKERERERKRERESGMVVGGGSGGGEREKWCIVMCMCSRAGGCSDTEAAGVHRAATPARIRPGACVSRARCIYSSAAIARPRSRLYTFRLIFFRFFFLFCCLAESMSVPGNRKRRNRFFGDAGHVARARALGRADGPKNVGDGNEGRDARDRTSEP